MNKLVLQAKNITKTYQEQERTIRVFRDLSLRVYARDVVAILGRSGSGKSSLLHVLGGLDAWDAGDVLIDAQSLAARSDAQRGRIRNEKLGFVYQFHHLLPEFTALDNVAMPLWIRGRAMRVARQKAQKILERVGLGHRLDHLPSQLSGGERQRVAIARAIVTRPVCILADRPTGNLDKKTAEEVFALFLELAREQGTAIVIVTHDATLAQSCGRVIQLRDGALYEQGLG